MSYQVLARKWRPSNFDEMVGQAHVLRALTSALDNERLHHAYLFTGTRGVGKTTISRILARCLNCETGIGSKPCGTCSACNEINEGRFVDLIEVDAASRSKVDETRELLANVQYRPTRGRYKVYLIDEVHMLSTHSFNALLKTLEEPPPHVVFLLATTDPQKLPATVLSRCLQFHLKNMQPDDMQKHLAHILTNDSIEYEDSALESLSWSAKGSMRDALSLLDQAIAFGDGRVSDKDVREMLGTIDRNQVYELLTAIANNDGAACMTIIEDLSQFAPDYEDVMGELLSVLHRVALLQQIPDVTIATQDQRQIELIAANISAEDVQLFYQLALHGRRDLPLAPDMRSGFEMSILRLMSFRPNLPKGVTPVKKSESSKLNKVEIPEVSSRIVNDINTDSISTASSKSEIARSTMSVSDISISDDIDEDDYSDPRDYEKAPIKTEQTTVSKTPIKSVSWAMKSPLLRNQQGSPEDEQKNNEYVGNEIESIIEVLPEAILETVPAVIEPVEEATLENIPVIKSIPDPTLETLPVIAPVPVIEAKTIALETEVKANKLASSDLAINNEAFESTQSSDSIFLNDKTLPSLENLTKENWHLLIENLTLLGVTEQIALNSQFENLQDNQLSFSLVNTMRSMLSNEHLNKMTAAIKRLYSNIDSISLAVTNLEPDHETPRQRRDRIRERRHQQACDNLYNDQQVQGILKTFSAKLDHETVESLI